MDAQSLKQLVEKIFNDPQSKAEFTKDPEGFIARYQLTEVEKKAVLATHARLGLVTDSTQLDSTYGPLSMWV